MFICVSLNPAIDKRLVVDRLTPGQIHRVRSVQAHAGGKAAHVAMALRALGEKPHWIGPTGGATGREVVAGLRSIGIEVRDVAVAKTTRTNLEIVENDGRITEILEPGEACTAEEFAQLTRLCGEIFRRGGARGIVVFSGSLPKNANPDLYARLILLARCFGCTTMLDTSGEALRAGLTAEPDLVKPNRAEAEALLGLDVASLNEAKLAAQRILAAGARSVALSLGSGGLLYVPAKGALTFHAPALKLEARSTVGCGDAALAGFAHAYSAGAAPEETLRLAAGCASANCVADSPGAIRSDDVERFRSEVRLERLG